MILIIGTGPAGLAAAYEFLRRSDRRVVLLEADGQVGGISKTVEFAGNRLDIGGHRFFTKSARVMRLWRDIAPADGSGSVALLRRRRLSRILHGGSLIEYPIEPGRALFQALGMARIGAIGLSYLKARARPIHPVRSLRDFYVNRFGTVLYETFFRDYTRKVWGVAPEAISPEWGAQRVKGLSIANALKHAVFGGRARRSRPGAPDRPPDRRVETSLIAEFLYPRLGPGELWEALAARIAAMGGEFFLNHRVTRLLRAPGNGGGNRIIEVEAVDGNGRTVRFPRPHQVISTMPLRDLARALEAPDQVREVTEGLVYRDFRIVGLAAGRLRRNNADGSEWGDNWLYLQDPEIRMGRLQLFHNWSRDLPADPEGKLLGLEYFCSKGDDLWAMGDGDFIELGITELERLGIIDRADIVASTSVRMPLAYPAYFGSYNRLSEVRPWLNAVENLFPCGRNGLHRYNNSDHSVLSAMVAADSALAGGRDRDAAWNVNIEESHHETTCAGND